MKDTRNATFSFISENLSFLFSFPTANANENYYSRGRKIEKFNIPFAELKRLTRDINVLIAF